MKNTYFFFEAEKKIDMEGSIPIFRLVPPQGLKPNTNGREEKVTQVVI